MLKACFILLTITLAIILFARAANIAGRAFTRVSEERRFKTKVALVLTGWLAYVTLLSVKNVFLATAFPPRIPLLLVLPPFLFFIYFFTSRKLKKIIDNTPPSWPVYFQSFRIVVELLLLGSFLDGVLPKAATFEGRNYDIVIGLTAPLVGYFAYTREVLSKKIAMLWNIAGLLTLLNVVVILLSHAYFYRYFNEPESILSKGFGAFPFTFLAGFYMPLAVFMHVFSIIKTRAIMR